MLHRVRHHILNSLKSYVLSIEMSPDSSSKDVRCIYGCGDKVADGARRDGIFRSATIIWSVGPEEN